VREYNEDDKKRLLDLGYSNEKINWLLADEAKYSDLVKMKMQKLNVSIDSQPLNEDCFDLLPGKLEYWDGYLGGSRQEAEQFLKVLLYNLGLKSAIQHAPKSMWFKVLEELNKTTEDSSESQMRS
jgi:hypothetical protein